MSVTIAALPPTVNELPPEQRSRLLKSTRKLGNVLGATPHVIDHHDSLRRDNFFSHSSSSSVTSLAAVTTTHIPDERPVANAAAPGAHKRRLSKELPRLLVLRLQSIPPPASESLVRSLTTSSATSLNVSIPPLSPTLPPRPLSTSMIPPSPAPTQESFNIEGVDKLRRKRMAKLTRTLGENIPAELVFPRHHKSPSEPPPTPRLFTFETERNTAPLAIKPTPPPLSQLLSKNTPSLSSPTGDDTQTRHRPLPPIPHSPRNASVQRSRSLTVGASATKHTAGSRRVIKKRSSPRIPETAPFASIQAPIPRVDENPQRSWDGEWNIKDDEERAAALRNLKCR